MKAAFSAVASLDLFPIPVSVSQPSGRRRTRAFFLLFGAVIGSYAAFLFINASPQATQHIVSVLTLADYLRISPNAPTCACTNTFSSSAFETVELPPALAVEKVLEWGAPPPAPVSTSAPPPRPRPRFVPFFSSPRHFCRRAYELKQACVLGTDTCRFEASYPVRALVLLVLEDVAYFCRQLANAVETSLVQHSQAFAEGAQMLTPQQFNSSARQRRQLFATGLYYTSRLIATEVQHYSNSQAALTLDASIGGTALSPPGCRCAPPALGSGAPFTPCESFVPWWSPVGTWPVLNCSVPGNAALRTPVNFVFNGSWWEGILAEAGMSPAFVAQFGSGPMEPSVYAADTGETISLYVVTIALLSDTVPDFLPLSSSSSSSNGSGSNLLYDAPSLVKSDYGRFFSACSPNSCSYVTFVPPYWTILVQIAVAAGSLYNSLFLTVYFFPSLFTPSAPAGGAGEGGEGEGEGKGAPLLPQQHRGSLLEARGGGGGGAGGGRGSLLEMRSTEGRRSLLELPLTG